MSAWSIVLFITAGLLLVVLFLLFVPVRADIQAKLKLFKDAGCKIRLRFLFGLFSYRIQLHMHLLDDPPLHLVLKDKKKERLLWRPGMQRKTKKHAPFPISAVWEKIESKLFIIEGECGVCDDAAAAALLAGTVMVAFNIGWSYINRNKFVPPPKILLKPVTDKDCYWMKMEWIGTCMPVHIITAILLWRKNARKEQKKAWHTQSKTF